MNTQLMVYLNGFEIGMLPNMEIQRQDQFFEQHYFMDHLVLVKPQQQSFVH